jgi:cell division septation protein DedD
MSDDTPTERFDPKSGGTDPEGTAGRPDGTPEQDAPTSDYVDTPTEAFDAAKSAQTPGDNAPTERFVPITGATGGAGNQPQPFDPTGGGAWPPVDAPTRILPTAGAAGAGAGAGAIPPARAHSLDRPVEGERKSRGLLYTLIALGAALLIAVIVLLLMFFGDQDPAPVSTPTATPTVPAEPTPSETPEPAPSPTPTQEPEPTEEPAVAPTFDSFEAPTSAGCEEGDDNAPIQISWGSRDATSAFVGVGTDDASQDPAESGLPPVFTYTGFAYECELPSQVYTVTLENADGLTTSQSVTIRP